MTEEERLAAEWDALAAEPDIFTFCHFDDGSQIPSSEVIVEQYWYDAIYGIGLHYLVEMHSLAEKVLSDDERKEYDEIFSGFPVNLFVKGAARRLIFYWSWKTKSQYKDMRYFLRFISNDLKFAVIPENQKFIFKLLESAIDGYFHTHYSLPENLEPENLDCGSQIAEDLWVTQEYIDSLFG